jgi:hypothetical protein
MEVSEESMSVGYHGHGSDGEHHYSDATTRHRACTHLVRVIRGVLECFQDSLEHVSLLCRAYAGSHLIAFLAHDLDHFGDITGMVFGMLSAVEVATPTPDFSSRGEFQEIGSSKPVEFDGFGP